MRFSGGHGLASVYAKTIRDSWPVGLGLAAFLGLTVLVAGAGMASYGTPEARSQIADFARSVPPAMQGMYGPPLAVEQLGGFLAWQYAGFFSLIVGLWSILALSSTISVEAARGSLDMVLATSLGRRRLALEKVAGHVTTLAASMAGFAVCVWLTGAIWASLPGDSIAPLAAAAFAAHIGLTGLWFGALAFCLSVLVGHRAAVGLAAAFMLGGYVAHGWSGQVAILAPAAALSPFQWIAGDVPLAQSPDIPAVLAVALTGAALLSLGIEAFARRDVAIRALRLPGLPSLPLGLRGPCGRAFAEHLPTGLAFGLGLGVYGLVMAASCGSFAAAMTSSSGMAAMFNDVFPGTDIRTSAGALQVAYVAFAFVAVGLAAAALVAGWASDEASARLEMILSTPHSRRRITLLAGIGALGALAVLTALALGGVALGSLLSGADVGMASGVLALGLYSAALLGAGFAVGGLVRAALGGPFVALVAIGTFFVGLLGAALRLPDEVRALALTSYLDRTVTGVWEPLGVGACLLLTAGGLALGAWGMGRRDIAR